MRIGLDCRLSGPTHAGIARYIENLLIRLPSLDTNIEWVYIFSDKKQFSDIVSRADKKFVKQLETVQTAFLPVRHYTVREQLELPKLLKSLQLDLLHVPHFNIPLLYGGKLVVTIHDLLWHEYKGTQVTTLKPWMYWLKYGAYRYVTTQAVKRAQNIFVPAETIKKTLKKYYPAVSNKIVVTKEGADDRLIKYKKTGVERDKKTLIYVGSLYPHKNVRLIIEALKQLPEWRLEIVGARSVFQEDIEKYAAQQEVGSQVEFTGYLTDDQLAKRIQSATALVQPSFSEGFGLTGVEALALGTPVLASNIPIFREIYQDAAIYFDPTSVKSFIRFLRFVKGGSIWQRKAEKVVKQYSWDVMAEQTLARYQNLLT